MKKVFLLIIFLAAVPAAAGLAVTALWNALIPATFGLAPITFATGTGLFVLGQILSGGAILALLIMWGALHAVLHHGGGADWHSRWHGMTDRQRRDFIERRRREHFGFVNRNDTPDDAAD